MSKKKIKKWCDFTQNRGYVLMAISRAKENPELSSSDEIVHRRVLVSEDEMSTDGMLFVEERQ